MFKRSSWSDKCQMLSTFLHVNKRKVNVILLRGIKSMVYSSQGRHNETSATDWQMTARRNNVISITLRQIYCRLP
jgi:hypothetical protein